MRERLKIFLPFSLTIGIFALDQFVKYLVVKNIPYHKVGFAIGGDLIRIIHTSNKAGAFSFGNGLPDILRIIVFWVISSAFLVGLVFYIIKQHHEFSALQRWLLAGIIGGGLGNIFDRFFRAEGVVDFIDVKFFGIFGLDRWPTFNIADAAVVVCVILLIISLFISGRDREGADNE